MRLLIISDTAISKKNGKQIVLEAPLREIESISSDYSEIIWIGFRKKGLERSSRAPVNKNIKLLEVSASGGNTFIEKIKILLHLFSYTKTIYSQMKNADILHVRLPSVPGIIAILLNYFLKINLGWIKYAGTWTEKAPLSYMLQRSFLKIYKQLPITILSKKKSFKNLIYIPNPVYNRSELFKNKKISGVKDFSHKLNLIFVGSLNNNKRPTLIINAISKFINNEKFGFLNIIGGGELHEILKNKISGLENKIFIRGICNRKELDEYYSLSHILICPSKSEGFPKVIAEAMSFGCIPVATSLDGIKEIIEHKKTGLLIDEKHIQKNLENTLKIIFQNEKLITTISRNTKSLVNQFTYENFRDSINSIINYKNKLNA